MEKIRLGRTELLVSRTSFGALPIQRISTADAVKLVRRAYEAGVNYFDTANAYTDSEKKLGEALRGVRQEVVISTKSGGKDKKTVLAHIENSLRSLQTDYIDLFQFHNPAELPDPNDPDGPFAAALEMKEKGYIRHIGITNHRPHVARAAIASGDFETLQFPFCYLASQTDYEIGGGLPAGGHGLHRHEGPLRRPFEQCGGLLCLHAPVSPCGAYLGHPA